MRETLAALRREVAELRTEVGVMRSSPPRLLERVAALEETAERLAGDVGQLARATQDLAAAVDMGIAEGTDGAAERLLEATPAAGEG